MGVPQTDLLAPRSPKQSAKDDINRVHVHEHSVIVFALAPDEAVEIEGISDTRNATLLSERKYAHVVRQMIFSHPECNDRHLRAVFCEFNDPPMEKPEDGVVDVDFLGENEEAHDLEEFVEVIFFIYGHKDTIRVCLAPECRSARLRRPFTFDCGEETFSFTNNINLFPCVRSPETILI